MEKIRALLAKCGLSQEASDALCEAFEQHETQLRERVEEEFTTRIDAAKRICIEETEAHKAEISRRVQIFLEANTSRIEQHIARQAMNREGQAIGLLEQVKGLIEGVSISPDESNAELKKLRGAVKKLAEERDQAVKVAKRQQNIAENVLKRNRDLEKQVALSEQEERPAPRRAPVNEARGNGGNRRIDQNRQQGRTNTTRRTLAESQERNAPGDNREGNVRGGGGSNTIMTPAQIAATIPDDVI